MPIAAKAFFTVTAGVIPEEPMPELSRQWGYTSQDFAEDKAAIDAMISNGPDGTKFLHKRNEAMSYARGLIEPGARELGAAGVHMGLKHRRGKARASRGSLEFRYISVTLKDASALMSTKDRALALECFQHWRSECQRLGPTAPNPESVAYSLHGIIDDRVQRMLETSKHVPACGKGCAACCHIHVDVFPQEAQLLNRIADESGIEIDAARLARQATKTTQTWHELTPEDQRCVFLAEDRSCRVYEHRPGACRKHLVKGDPDLCDMQRHPGGQVAIVFDVEAEIVHSAAMTVYGVGNMATMLLKHQPAEA